MKKRKIRVDYDLLWAFGQAQFCKAQRRAGEGLRSYNPMDVLREFWEIAGRVERSKHSCQDKSEALLRMVKWISRKRYKSESRRISEHGERRGKWPVIRSAVYGDLLGCGCFVCSSSADARHHLIQLQHGGSSHHLNIVPLCKSCHAKIHPWLDPKKKKNRWGRYV